MRMIGKLKPGCGLLIGKPSQSGLRRMDWCKMVDIQTLEGCCGIDEVIGVIEYDQPKSVLNQLCYSIAGDRYNTRTNKYEMAIHPQAHYIFTGVVAYKGRGRTPTYCQNLKSYILRNKLGAVTESGMAPNRNNHPTHLLRAYIFTPNVKALSAWYKKNKKAVDDDDEDNGDIW